MSETWFRHWAKEHLLSDDLYALTDHEERVWWRLLSVASLEEERWTTPISKRLAEKCMSTPAKLTKALNKMADLGMVTIREEVVTIANAEKWNEEKNGKPPSADKEAVRERVNRHRDKKRNVTSDVTTCNDVTVTTPVTRYGNDHKEIDPEKEREPERAAAAADPDDPPDEAFGSAVTAWTEATGQLVTAMLGDEIGEWLAEYPRPWVLDAIRETGLSGSKSAKYTAKILQRWQSEGRDRPKAAPSAPVVGVKPRFWASEIAEMEAEREKRRAVAK